MTLTDNKAQPEFDQNSVSWISSPADAAWKQMESILSDGRYSEEYKREQIASIRSTAHETLETRYRESVVEIEGKIKDRDVIVSYQPVLTADADIQKLNYIAATLQVNWKHQKPEAMRQDWKAALERKDTITAQVYRDFSRPHFQGTLPANITPQDYQSLAEQTNDLLSTPERRQAKRELAYWQRTLQLVHEAHGGAKNRLNGRIGNDGKLVDAATADYMARLRNR
jgi:hypothetical protein